MSDAYTLRKRKGFSPRERSIIAKIWEDTCAYCKKPEGPFAIDHIIPFSEGGSCEYDNLCLACVKCNAQKSDVRLLPSYEGLILSVAKRKAKRIKKRLSSTYRKPSPPKEVNHAGWLHKDKKHAIEVAKLLSSMLKLDYEATVEPRLDGFLPARERLTFKVDKGLVVGLGRGVEEVLHSLVKTVIVQGEGGTHMSSLHVGSCLDKKRGTGTFSISVNKDELREFIELIERAVEQ